MDLNANERSSLLNSRQSGSIGQWSPKDDSLSSNLGQESKKENRIWSVLCSIFPILIWLPKYCQHWRDLLKYDLLAGVTAGVTIIPKNIAYATVAGLDPIYGIYASCIPSFIYFFFGSSRHLLVGPTAVISLLVANALKDEDLSDSDYVRRALQMSLLAGLFCLLIGMFQLGFIAKFISRPVVAGFTNASAILIGCSQLNPFLGIKAKSHSSLLYATLETTFTHIGDTKYLCVIIGGVSLVVILAGKKIKYGHIIPVSLFVVIGCTLLSWLLKLDDHGVPIVGSVPSGFPRPTAVIFKSWSEFSNSLTQSVLIALIALLESYSIAKTFATKFHYTIQPNQELVALGMGNFVGSFFSCYPVTGSFSGTAVNQRAGARSGVSNLVCCVCVFVVMMALTSLIKYLPSTCLAAIVLSAVASLIDFGYIQFLWKTSKEDFAILVVCWVGAMAVGIELGVCIGIGFSILLTGYRIAHPKIIPLGLRSKGSLMSESEELQSSELQVVDAASSNVELESTAIIRMEAPLLFLNAETLKDALIALAWNGTFRHEVSGWKGNKAMYDSFSYQSIISATPTNTSQQDAENRPLLSVLPPKVIILDMQFVTMLDATGIEVLEEIYGALQRTQVKLLFAETRQPVLEMLKRSKAMDKLGAANFLATVVDAATEAHKLTRSSLTVGLSVHHPLFGHVKVVT